MDDYNEDMNYHKKPLVHHKLFKFNFIIIDYITHKTFAIRLVSQLRVAFMKPMDVHKPYQMAVTHLALRFKYI